MVYHPWRIAVTVLERWTRTGRYWIQINIHRTERNKISFPIGNFPCRHSPLGTSHSPFAIRHCSLFISHFPFPIHNSPSTIHRPPFLFTITIFHSSFPIPISTVFHFQFLILVSIFIFPFAIRHLTIPHSLLSTFHFTFSISPIFHFQFPIPLSPLAIGHSPSSIPLSPFPVAPYPFPLGANFLLDFGDCMMASFDY